MGERERWSDVLNYNQGKREVRKGKREGAVEKGKERKGGRPGSKGVRTKRKPGT